MSKRILLVGHCGVDGPRLQREIASFMKAAEAPRINSIDDLKAAVEEGADLLLVNREPVGFSEPGLDLIRQVRSQYPDQKVMLVSDYPDAQEEATAAGALPGFGKSDIGTLKFTDTVRQAVGA